MSAQVRFAKPVLPGQTLRTNMWREGNRIHFETTVEENNSKVLTGGYVDLKQIKTPFLKQNLCSATTKNLESDAVFAQMSDYIKSNPDQVKKINGVFHYIILDKGVPSADWSESFSF